MCYVMSIPPREPANIKLGSDDDIGETCSSSTANNDEIVDERGLGTHKRTVSFSALPNRDVSEEQETLIERGSTPTNDTTTTPTNSNDESNESNPNNVNSSANRKNQAIKSRVKKSMSFPWLKLAQLFCALYIIMLTFSKSPFGLVDPITNRIIDTSSTFNTDHGVIMVNGDYRPVVANSPVQMLCLAISRISAFSMYPVIIVVFLTKCRALLGALDRTPLSMFMISCDRHELHVYAGGYIAFDVFVHTIFHLVRWGLQGNISLLWTSLTGLSGALVLIFTVFITFPMMYFKRSISYEIRKGLHYFFFLFAIGMCYHVPVSGFPNGGFLAPVMGFLLCLYILDTVVVNYFMSEKVETTKFHVLPTGVIMSMDVSDDFQKRMCKGGVAYICLPWIDRSEWHAFSLFEHPTIPKRREVFMLKAGDWTEAVHKALQRDTVRPVWVQGPFESPYNNAISYDNQILVASGIGITPALSVIRNHKESRQINLVWACRDPAMLEFFLEHLYLDHSGWNLIFYTGKKSLNPAIEGLNTNVRVVKGRPNLEIVIPNIIYGIESGEGRPESYTSEELKRVKNRLSDEAMELDKIKNFSVSEKLNQLRKSAREEGFLFTELLSEDDDAIIREVLSEEKEEESAAVTLNGTGDHRTDGLRQRKCASSSSLSQRGLFENASATLASASADKSYSNNHKKTLMQKIGQNSSGTIKLQSAFEPWEPHDTAQQYVKDLDPDLVIPTWGILYCGGSPAVESILKKISRDYSIELHTESFAW